MATAPLSIGRRPESPRALDTHHGVKVKSIATQKGDSVNDLIKAIVSSNPSQRDPFYVLDLGTVAGLYMRWSLHLPAIQPYFAVKCNPDPVHIGTLAALGANFDCASLEEIRSVLALGVSPDRIIYANPCKADTHVHYACAVGVGLATFDSDSELEKMRKHHPDCSLLLRIKPPLVVGVRQDLGSKFGALPEEVGPLLRSARSKGLSVVGVSFHVGTDATVFECYSAAIEAARSVFELAVQVGGVRMHLLDIGGGFTAGGGRFEKAAATINSSLEAHFGDWQHELKVIAEPGKYFAETAATLATCVIGKRARGEVREYWLNDGTYGSWGCIKMGMSDLSIIPLEQRPEGTETWASTVFGPTCDSMDVMGREVQLPELEVGEWMVSPNMGAYTKALGSDFNGFSTRAISTYIRPLLEGKQSYGMQCTMQCTPSPFTFLDGDVPTPPPPPPSKKK